MRFRAFLENIPQNGHNPKVFYACWGNDDIDSLHDEIGWSHIVYLYESPPNCQYIFKVEVLAGTPRPLDAGWSYRAKRNNQNQPTHVMEDIWDARRSLLIRRI